MAITGDLRVGPLPLKANAEVRWTHQGKKYIAKNKVNVLQNKTVVSTNPSPPYDDLWADREFNGMVVAGSNLGGPQSASTMNEYVAYYQSQGFEFGKEPKTVEQFSKYFSNAISSGRIDFFLKEAHSDGDEKNLFRVDESSKILTGTKKTGKGTETVELVFPSGGANQTRLISNHEFGEMIRSRDTAKKGPLVYFNASCWSKTKAINELEAAQSTKLINIPTLTVAHTFTTAETDAARLMLQAFRDGKSYQGIREAMTKNEGYKNGTGDVFLFPDEDRYRTHILDVLKTPLKIDTKITRNGVPYNIDQSSLD